MDFVKELVQGTWVTSEKWTAKTGITEKTFANGLQVVERPSGKIAGTVPKEWLEGGNGLPKLKQLLQGSWVTQESTHFATGETKQVFANGVEVLRKPHSKPIVTVPKVWLNPIGR